MFIRNGIPMHNDPADYIRDFGNIVGTRFIHLPADRGVYLWHATLASQAFVGTRLLEKVHRTGVHYFLMGTPELFLSSPGIGHPLEGGLEQAHQQASERLVLPPYFEGAAMLVRYRELSFDALVQHVAHLAFRVNQNRLEMPLRALLNQVLRAFRQVPELYSEDLLRKGMDDHALALGFKASDYVTVGDDSFDRYLLRAIEALAPQQTAALQAEVQR